MQRLLALAFPVALSTLAAGGAGCADERALIVDLTVRGDGDGLCLAAVADEEVVFDRAYGAPAGSAPQGSLTFVAGERVNERLRVTAWLTRGGRVLGRATGESAFGELDELHLPLEVARCTPRSPMMPSSLREVASVDVLEDHSLAAVDIDADGRDELLLPNGASGLAAMDAESGTARRRDLPAIFPAGSLLAAGALLDGDCTQELLLTSPEGVIIAPAGGRSMEIGAPLGPAAHSVAAGGFDGTSSRLAIAGPEGLALAAVEGGPSQIVQGGSFRFLAVGDLTSDGLDDLAAASEEGARVWIGSGAGLSEVAGALPASFSAVSGPLAMGDLDDDGALDLIGAAGNTVRIAHNRGDGLLQDRTGPMPPAMAATIGRVIVVDLDGDCRDDVVLLDADGAVLFLRSGPDLTFTASPLPVDAAWDVAAADVDGDGRWELALLTRTGTLEVWGR